MCYYHYFVIINKYIYDFIIAPQSSHSQNAEPWTVQFFGSASDLVMKTLQAHDNKQCQLRLLVLKAFPYKQAVKCSIRTCLSYGVMCHIFLIQFVG